MTKKLLKVFSSGNEEVDRQLGGGIPVPSFVLLEGDHGTGKSALMAQFMYGFLKSRQNVLCITESTTNEYIEKMKSITFNFTIPFLQNRLKIVPLQSRHTKWTKEAAKNCFGRIYPFIVKNSKKYPIIIIDSISLLTLFSTEDEILDFLSKCKQLIGKNVSIFLTMHLEDVTTNIALRLKSMSDVYLKLGQAMVGGKIVKTVNTVKLLGAQESPESNFAFEVDMIFGIKIVPVSMANA